MTYTSKEQLNMLEATSINPDIPMPKFLRRFFDRSPVAAFVLNFVLLFFALIVVTLIVILTFKNSFFLLICWALVALGYLFLFAYSKKAHKSQVTLIAPDSIYAYNNEFKNCVVKLNLNIKNNTIFPYFNYKAKMTISNGFFEGSDSFSVYIPCIQKHTAEIEIPIKVNSLGMVRISDITIYNNIGVLSTLIFQQDLITVPVLPIAGHKADFPNVAVFDGADEVEENNNLGSVSGEVKEIREYQPGDRLQRIHWKLSAKMDDLFVKEMSHTSAVAVTLLPNTVLEDTKMPKNNEHFFLTLKTLYEISKTLNSENQRFLISILNPLTLDIDEITVMNGDDIMKAFYSIYALPLNREEAGKTNIKDAFLNASSGVSVVCFIDGDEYELIEREIV